MVCHYNCVTADIHCKAASGTRPSPNNTRRLGESASPNTINYWASPGLSPGKPNLHGSCVEFDFRQHQPDGGLARLGLLHLYRQVIQFRRQPEGGGAVFVASEAAYRAIRLSHA